MTVYIFIALLSVFTASCSQMLLKQAARKPHTSWWRQYLNAWVICGYGILFMTMVLNIWCMHNGLQLKQLSVIESTSYLFVPALSWYLFHEPITPRKALAIAMIIIGVVVFFL